MKKTIVYFLVLALICFLLCACTSPDPEPKKPAGDNSLPAPSEPAGQMTQAPAQAPTEVKEQNPTANAPDETKYIQESTEAANVTEAVNITEQTDSYEPIAPEEITDTAVVSEYVVDGGNGFGFGGN